ncbi:MAG: 16S rRNA (cytidine(1402)-2'-O)-methyltransferase [Armatimonadetes bacterium]|nr:16S rRNA (cytidine(1402)-2'-O)-methyltransferase [Armatimonadota bacterium]
MAGRLVVVATPIGNLEDFSPRAKRELSEADLWLVEDTRVTGKLQMVLGVKKPMRVLNDHTSPKQIGALAEIAEEQVVALVSDAGVPVVSDPGAELIEACQERGVEVDVVPGPSAVTTALAHSGFFAQRFAFLGFLSRKAGPAAEALAPFAESSLTLVLFESPYRIGSTLEACHRALGSRRYVVCRELTKKHQQVWRGTLPELPTEQQVPRKGEFTLVVEGRRRNQP